MRNNKDLKKQRLVAFFFWFTILTCGLVLISVLPAALAGRDRSSIVFVGNVPNLQNGLNTSVTVAAGNILSFFTYGTWFICNNTTSPLCISNASGVPGTDIYGNAVIPFVPLGTLIGNVSNCFFVIAYNTSVVSPCNGTLILLMNDNDYSDNFAKNLTVTFTVTTGTNNIFTTTTSPTPTTPPPPLEISCFTQPRPSIIAACDPLFSLTYQEAPLLSYDASPLRFAFDENFLRPIYMYQTADNQAIVVVSPTWTYTITNGFNPTTSYMLLDCVGNVYVLVSTNFNQYLTTLTKIDASGIFQWSFSIDFGHSSPPVIIGDHLFAPLSNNAEGYTQVVKFNISSNGNATRLPVYPGYSGSSITGFKDRFFLWGYAFTAYKGFVGPVFSFDLDGNLLNQSAEDFVSYGSYTNPVDGSVYFTAYQVSFAFKKRQVAPTQFRLLKYDENLNLVYIVNLTDINAWSMKFQGNRIFVDQQKLYYISSTGYPYGSTYFNTYSDVNATLLSSTIHPFSVDVADVSLSFDALSKTVFFLGLGYPNGVDPITAAINSFCL